MGRLLRAHTINHIRWNGYLAAIPLIQADIELLKSSGFSESVLCGVALLHGVGLEV